MTEHEKELCSREDFYSFKAELQWLEFNSTAQQKITARYSYVFCPLCQPYAPFCGIAVESLCSDLKANLNKKKMFLQGLVPSIDSLLGQKGLGAFKRKGVRKCGGRGGGLQDSS